MENAIKKMESVINWIPASEAPEKDEFYIDCPLPVLVCTDKHVFIAQWAGYRNDDENVDWEFSPVMPDDNFWSTEVKYWAFLPYGPDEEVKTK